MQIIDVTPINIFLVDDHKTVLWGLERLIESAEPSMRVVGKAESCEDLLARLPGTRADVILLDLDLGGKSALSCLEKLSQCSKAKVMILTGSSDPAAHQQAVMRGARGVVHKQVAAELLLRAIEKVHQGEIWLDRATLYRVVSKLSVGEKASTEASGLARLTSKELQIVKALVDEKGARNKLIAEKLHMSEHTLRNHLTVIYDKLRVAGRMELYLFASRELQAGAAI